MKCVQKGSINGAALPRDKPLSRNLETVQEYHTAVSQPDLVNRPSEFLRPLLGGGGMVSAQHVEMSMHKRAIWDLGYAFDVTEILVEKSDVDEEGETNCEGYEKGRQGGIEVGGRDHGEVTPVTLIRSPVQRSVMNNFGRFDHLSTSDV